MIAPRTASQLSAVCGTDCTKESERYTSVYSSAALLMTAENFAVVAGKALPSTQTGTTGACGRISKTASQTVKLLNVPKMAQA